MQTSDPPLEKIVTHPNTRNAWKVGSVICFVLLSVIGNLVVGSLYAWERKARQLASHNEDVFRGEAERLREENAGLHRDMGALMPEEVPALRVSSDEDRMAVEACLRAPERFGLLVRLSVSGQALRTFQPQDIEPIFNAFGEEFPPNGLCALSSRGAFRVAHLNADLYKLRPWTPFDERGRAGACPEGAFRLVSSRNTLIWYAIFRACLTRVKLRTLGLAHDDIAH